MSGCLGSFRYFGMFYMEFIFVKREDKMKTKINHAWVLTMNQEFQMYRDGYVVIEDQKIVETGDGERQRVMWIRP